MLTSSVSGLNIEVKADFYAQTLSRTVWVSKCNLSAVTCLLVPLLFVHLVSKAHGVDHGEAESDVTLLQIISLSPQLHLRLKVGRLKVLKVGVEQSVHQG